MLVRKHLFYHFYVVGVSWSALLLYSCNSTHQTLFKLIRATTETAFAACAGTTGISDVTFAEALQVNLCLVAILLHCSIRLWESLFLFEQGAAQMHIVGYLLGVSFYLAAPWTVVVRSSYWNARASVEGEVDAGFAAKGLFAAAGFLWASAHQHRCHRLLAGLRKKEEDPGRRYKIPRGDLFEVVSCPHYFTEIVIFFVLVVWIGLDINTVLLLMFVALNLSITARKTHQWYLDRFPQQYPKDRRAIIPYVM